MLSNINFGIWKYIVIALVAALILGFITFKILSSRNQLNLNKTNDFQTVDLTTTSTPAASLVDKVSEDITLQSLQSKIISLEATINDLKARIVVLEAKQVSSAQSTLLSSQLSTSTTTSTQKSPTYIPIAATGSTQNSDWTDISGTTVSIDPADYPGYTSMQFEANIQIFQTGTAYARVGSSDGTSVLASEISTSSTSYTYISSGKFNLPSGKKNYLLQLKSQITGYASSIQNARIKVNF